MKYNTTVINLFAGPGTGKSMIAAGIFSLLKLHNINCEYVSEFAKDLTWESRTKTLANQLYIFGKQYHRQWRLLDQVEVLISDSPLINGLLYGTDGDLQKIILSKFSEFTNLNYFLTRTKPYNSSGRRQTETEAIILDNKTKLLLTNNNIKFEKIDGNFTAINIITEKFLKNLGIKRKYKLKRDR